MIGNIDEQVSNVAKGDRSGGQYFPADIVQTWQDALAAHAQKKARFDTGPQARMFRQGGDGQAAIQGAEIPREFFNSRASQIEDAASFQRLTGGDAGLQKALKSYAMTDMSQQVTKDGMLSAKKLGDWASARSGALKNTMNESDNALINELVTGVKQADSAANLGKAVGSNTKQNQEAAARFMGNGVLDSPVINMLANRTPLIGSFTGPMLDGLRKTAAGSKADKLGGLLSDPQVFSKELKSYLAKQSPSKLRGLLDSEFGQIIGQIGYRSAPLAMSD